MKNNSVKVLILLLLVAVAAWLWVGRDDAAVLMPATEPKMPRIVEHLSPAERLAAIYEADQIEDPVERCLNYPIPEGLPREHVYYARYCEEASIYKDHDTVKRLLNEGEFAQVDELIDSIQAEYLATGEREYRVYDVLDLFNDASFWNDQTTAAWLEAQPESHAAHVARSWFLRAKAYGIQGGWRLSMLSEEKREKFNNLNVEQRALLDRALELNPRFLPAISRRMSTTFWEPESDIERYFAQGMAVDPDSFDLRWQLINGLPTSNQEEWEIKRAWEDKFREDLAGNFRLASFRTESYKNRGKRAYRDGDYEELLEITSEGLNNSPSLGMLEYAAFSHGDMDDPLKEFEFLSKGSSYWRHDPSTDMYRAEILNDMGEYQWAADMLEKSAERYPGYHWTYSHLAKSYIELGRFEDAVSAHKRNLENWPDDTHSQGMVAYLYIDYLNQKDRATPYIDALLAADPESVLGLRLRMDSLEGQDGEALYQTMEQFLRYVDRSNEFYSSHIATAEATLARRDQQLLQEQAASDSPPGG